MAIEDKVLTRLAAEPREAIAPRIRDGDLLLCSGNDPFSRLIGAATKSPWTHVAFAWRWPDIGRIMVFEAVQQLGVRTVPLQTFLSQSSTGKKPYPGKIVLARHQEFADAAGKPGSAAAKRLGDAAVDRLGDRFSGVEVAKIGARISIGRWARKMPRSLGPRDEYICSEYVAKCFAAAGVTIAWDGLGFIAPCDFARDPNVKALARFRTK
ncbi:MAG TPA: hypothetical protein VIC25_10340 [Caulobacteraceae bacterium]|jgi:hypothetical protein